MTAQTAVPGTSVTRNPGGSRRRRHNPDRRGPGSYIVVIVVALITLLPFVYAILGSFRTTGQISADPLGLPNPIQLGNYSQLIFGAGFWQPLGNSVLIAIITTVLVLVLASLAAFALSRLHFRGREGIYTFFTIGLLFPSAVAILPLYLTLRVLHLLDSPFGVALPQAAFALPMTIVILRPFFQGVPVELEDASAMDGLGRFGFYWRILLPMSVPALVTVGILSLLNSWNGYLLPLLVLTTPEQYTLPLGVAQFHALYTFDVAKTLAYTVLAILPTLIAYAIGERWIVRGLMSGAVKG